MKPGRPVPVAFGKKGKPRVRRCARCRHMRSRLVERANGQVVCSDCSSLDRQLSFPGFDA